MDSLTHSTSRTQTKIIHNTRFAFFLLASLLMALCVLMPEKALAEKEKPVQKTELGKFKVMPMPAGEAFTLDIQHEGKSIAQSKKPVTMISYDEIQKDVPLPGCETLKVNLNEGNNFSYYLLSSCKDKDFAAYVKPYDGEVTFNSELKTYTATDPFFMAYTPKLATSDGGMTLSREESPRINRVLVFEEGAWRADKTKEFVDFYTALQQQAQGDETNVTAAQSIAATYYASMAGAPRMQASSLLKKLLPSDYTILSDKIYGDTQKAIRGFDIVENLMLGKPSS